MNIKQMILKGPSAPFAPALERDMAEMEERMLSLCPGAGELGSGLRRVMSAGGKRLRPLLAWTCWHMAGGEMPIVPLMCMLELMHTTSLIHDDLVDGADSRRGVATINATDGAGAAIAGGDYLLSCAMELLPQYRGTGINEALSRVSQEMCLGELDQHGGLFSLSRSGREQYFLRIKRKTALLMAESCRSGALAGGDRQLAERLWDYGLHLGNAFQLRDDLCDWDPDSRSGKPPLRDLQSGVISLPLICAAERAGGQLVPLIESPKRSPRDNEFIFRHVLQCGALEETQEMLKKECACALSALSGLPSRAERASLSLLAETLMEVKKIG